MPNPRELTNVRFRLTNVRFRSSRGREQRLGRRRLLTKQQRKSCDLEGQDGRDAFIVSLCRTMRVREGGGRRSCIGRRRQAQQASLARQDT